MAFGCPVDPDVSFSMATPPGSAGRHAGSADDLKPAVQHGPWSGPVSRKNRRGSLKPDHQIVDFRPCRAGIDRHQHDVLGQAGEEQRYGLGTIGRRRHHEITRSEPVARERRAKLQVRAPEFVRGPCGAVGREIDQPAVGRLTADTVEAFDELARS
jgi:hypothetical protein